MECPPGGLTILLRDEYQGGVKRPTSTISGGESFLVSLALALGLSSLNRKSLSVDVLFIDEGFGTLDSDYLNTVMEALEKLHQIGGKKVGIISHVEALRERIATQIHVERVNHTLSRGGGGQYDGKYVNCEICKYLIFSRLKFGKKRLCV